MPRRVAFLLAGVMTLMSGCSIASGDDALLGGREKCWPESESRLATLMMGTLELEPARPELATPEGEVFPLDFAGVNLGTENGGFVLVDRERRTVAPDGELVTVWGGLGTTGSILVCGIEERHGGGREPQPGVIAGT